MNGYTKPQHIRALTDLDSEAYWRLRLASIYQASALARPELARELGLYARGWRNVPSLYASEEGRVWGTFCAGALVGVIAASRYLMREGVELNLWGLYVDAPYRGSRAGSLLARTALDWCRHQKRVRAVTAHVHPDEHRVRIWCVRNGFEPVEVPRSRQLQVLRLCLLPAAARGRRAGQAAAVAGRSAA